MRRFWDKVRMPRISLGATSPEPQTRNVCRMCKGAVAGLCILMALLWSMSRTHSSALDFPRTYLTNALLPVFIVSLSAYFVAELWAQVGLPFYPWFDQAAATV